MSISPTEKLTEDVALLTKLIFMGKKANLVKSMWFVKYFFDVFAADFNLRKNVFHRHFIMADCFSSLSCCLFLLYLNTTFKNPSFSTCKFCRNFVFLYS